jgi:type II secretory pathway pseudopilin PulG
MESDELTAAPAPGPRRREEQGMNELAPDPAPAPPPAHPRLPSRPPQGGFSLIEVLAAAALLAGVMISIMTLFIQGGQKVNSGKLMTKAISIATEVQEKYRELSFESAYLLIEDGGAPATDTQYCWDSRGDALGDCVVYNEPTDPTYRDILGIGAGTEPGWKQDVEQGLPNGSITITVRGLAGMGTEPAEINFGEARVIQVVATIRWIERRNNRSIVFETIKV